MGTLCWGRHLLRVKDLGRQPPACPPEAKSRGLLIHPRRPSFHTLGHLVSPQPASHQKAPAKQERIPCALQGCPELGSGRDKTASWGAVPGPLWPAGGGCPLAGPRVPVGALSKASSFTGTEPPSQSARPCRAARWGLRASPAAGAQRAAGSGAATPCQRGQRGSRVPLPRLALLGAPVTGRRAPPTHSSARGPAEPGLQNVSSVREEVRRAAGPP